jgi:thiol-disulfide isomerase/thioredoxin
VLENYAFLDEDAQTERRLGEFYQDGKLLIVQWSSGWCIVCKEDTWVFNQWQAEHGPNGLRILSLLYEDSAEQPMTAGFLAWWKQVFSVTYPLWIDPTTAGPDGKAAGGALSDFIAPKGPYSDGAFPVTLLVCPETMKILYEKQAFKYAEVQPLVDLYLYEVDCAK